MVNQKWREELAIRIKVTKEYTKGFDKGKNAIRATEIREELNEILRIVENNY